MHHPEQVRVIEGLMAHLDNDTNVDAGVQLRNPVTAYTCEDRARKEWKAFFQAYPHALGLSGDLPEPGSFFTSSDLGKPILCTRDEGGTFRAFLNVCRHRGTIVESEARGKKKLFVCPFHAWSYDTSGNLKAVPKEDHFGKIYKDCNGLVELPAAERHGLLFVSPEIGGTLDIDELLGDLGSELANWQLDQCVRHGGTRFDHPMNWKLAIDTFGETYHFEALHKDTLAPFFYGNVQMYDRYKRNHRMSLCLRNIDTLREKSKNEWHILQAAVPVYYLFPNIQLIINADGPTLVRVYPNGDDPNNSFSEIGFYLYKDRLTETPETQQRRDTRNLGERLEGFAEVIQSEDYVAAASSHVGALSGAQDYVTFGRNEPALHHYHNTYNAALGLPPLEEVVG